MGLMRNNWSLNWNQIDGIIPSLHILHSIDQLINDDDDDDDDGDDDEYD